MSNQTECTNRKHNLAEFQKILTPSTMKSVAFIVFYILKKINEAVSGEDEERRSGANAPRNRQSLLRGA